jgi:hypothetical protein
MSDKVIEESVVIANNQNKMESIPVKIKTTQPTEKQKNIKNEVEPKKSRRRHFDSEYDVEMHAGALTSIILPVVITFIFVIATVLSIGVNTDDILLLLFPNNSMYEILVSF